MNEATTELDDCDETKIGLDAYLERLMAFSSKLTTGLNRVDAERQDCGEMITKFQKELEDEKSSTEKLKGKQNRNLTTNARLL